MHKKVNYKFDKEKQKSWFPYSVSDVKDDFIIQNGVHGHCPNEICDDDCNSDNVKYWHNFKIDDIIDNSPEIGCFGCSFTYGSFLSQMDTWPNILGQELSLDTGNFGVPGGGADSCFVNLKNAFHRYKIKKAIILLPVMARRLLKFELNSLHFQMPIGPHTEWPFDVFASQQYFDKNFIMEKIQAVKNEIQKDSDNAYSKNIVYEIKKFCKINEIDLYASSWDFETYRYLKDESINLLPFYDMSFSNQRAGDGQHPCRQHNVDWVSTIKTRIL
tara:strand:- start:283 stop:1101 length:819 start_codon:yes stop_codon:yes gene_type:complete